MYWQDKIKKNQHILRHSDISFEERGNAMVGIARAYSGLGNTNAAIILWQRLLTADNVDNISKTRANYELGYLYEQEQKWEDAIKYYRAFSSMYLTLPENDQNHFDQVSEDGDVILYHIGEIQEHHLRSPIDAETTYRMAIERVVTNNTYTHMQLLEHFGDFYLRQSRYAEAIHVFEQVSELYTARKDILVSPGSRPDYKILKSLLQAGKREEAEKRYEEFTAKWGGTKYQLDKEYVEKARVLMRGQGIK